MEVPYSKFMLPNTRQSAITAQSLYYFTGLPCRRNHVAKRYTRNGSCYECLHPSFVSPELEARRVERVAVKEARREMKPTRFRVADIHLENFQSIVWATALPHCSHLTVDHIKMDRPSRAMGAGRALHWFRVFPEDEPRLHEIERQLENEYLGLTIISSPGAPAIPADYWPEHDPR